MIRAEQPVALVFILRHPGCGAGWNLLQKAILDRLSYPIFDQSLGDIRHASAVSSELGKPVQILPGRHCKRYRFAFGIGHTKTYHTSGRLGVPFDSKKTRNRSPFVKRLVSQCRSRKKGGRKGRPKVIVVSW